MIAITLNFKSIEAARQALLEIPSSSLVDGPAPEPVKETKPAPKADAKGATSPATATKSAAPEKKTASAGSDTTSSAAASGAAEGNAAVAGPAQETAAAPAASSAGSGPSIDYAVLQKAVFALAGKSREAAAAVAAGFGVKTFKELTADKWSEALGAVQEKLAELENV